MFSMCRFQTSSENWQNVAQIQMLQLRHCIVYLSAFAAFPFFLPLPGTALIALRGRAFPPLVLKSTDTIWKTQHYSFRQHATMNTQCHHTPQIWQLTIHLKCQHGALSLHYLHSSQVLGYKHMNKCGQSLRCKNCNVWQRLIGESITELNYFTIYTHTSRRFI